MRGILLGDRPTALDCIVLGGLRAHTNMDPDPKKVTAAYPTVIDWAERRADQWDGTGELLDDPAESDLARLVLDEMADTYGKYVLGNRDAQSTSAKAFHVPVYGEDVSYLSRPYPEQSRQMVLQRIANLDEQQQHQVAEQLQTYRLSQVFA